ncbi:MAG: hypothetical protein C4524_04280 [Candidatus Zixiibacteriota bacterium]|nr:MAG: hypothetical protein C4524_04280 [candidate division Zixibacteria bacterium]
MKPHRMTIFAGMLGAALLLSGTPAPAQNTCITCHRELGGDLAAPVTAAELGDIHAARGLSCADCHGGDPTAEDAEVSMSPQRGFMGTPQPQEIPAFCGRCHSDPRFMRRFDPAIPTDQVEKFWTSHHGQALQQGDTRVATCVDCHDTHAILPSDNPKSWVWPVNVPATCHRCHGNADLMSAYNLPADVYDQYARGVHGHALLDENDTGAPACNDCHGNHSATPPGFESVAQVCRSCHPANSEMFMVSPHRPAFDALGLPECAACHDHHEILPPVDAWLGVEGEHSCGQCHSPGDPGYQASLAIHGWVDSLVTAMETAQDLVDQVERTGIETEEAHEALTVARNALLKSRTVIHTVREDSVEQSVEEGLAAAGTAFRLSLAALEDFRFRKFGLGFASIFITLLIVALWLKLRHMEKNKSR